jgi:prepilin-type N-terminal cleavage/methylation domain-containing protein
LKKYSLLQRLNYLLWNKRINKQGLSFIELIIVIAIVAILSVLIAINFSFFDNALIKSEIQKIHTVCHYLRRKAMMVNEIQTLMIDLHNNTYLYGTVEEKFAQHVRINFMPGIKGPPSAPIHTVTKPITFKNSQIIFYPSGVISAGTIYLTDTYNHYQYALSVPIASISYIRMYQYDKKWKLVS